VCAQGCARRGGAGGGFNRARVTGVERWASAPMAHGGAPPRLLLLAQGGRREGGAGDKVEWPGGAGRRPDQV